LEREEKLERKWKFLEYFFINGKEVNLQIPSSDLSTFLESEGTFLNERYLNQTHFLVKKGSYFTSKVVS
jgi:hypothetical protein